MKKESKKITGAGTGAKKASRKNSTEEITRRHLKDKNDKITDEDIRNIRVATEIEPEEEPEIPKEKRAHDVDKDNPKTTPWDVISE